LYYLLHKSRTNENNYSPKNTSLYSSCWRKPGGQALPVNALLDTAMGQSLEDFFCCHSKEFKKKRSDKAKKIAQEKEDDKPKRVKPGYTCADVDEWLREDEFNEIPMETNYKVGDKVKFNGQIFTVHNIKWSGLVLAHPGGAQRWSIRNEQVERA
jgi:hypothetical protein